jgi:hypothetical protein
VSTNALPPSVERKMLRLLSVTATSSPACPLTSTRMFEVGDVPAVQLTASAETRTAPFRPTATKSWPEPFQVTAKMSTPVEPAATATRITCAWC